MTISPIEQTENLSEDEKYDYRKLPYSLVTNSSFILPPKDRGNRDSLFFQITTLFEAQYKNQGITNGYLQSDRYVSFSEDALLASFSAKQAIPSSIAEILALYKKDPATVSKFIYPLSACPSNNVGTVSCPNLGDIVSKKQNPLEFTIKNVSFAYGIHHVKSLFNRTRRPLAFSLPEPITSYYFECPDQNDQRCFSQASGATTVSRMPVGYSYISGVPYTHLKALDLGQIRSFLLYGYNDNFIMTDIATGNSLTGGFILRDFEGITGHSLEFLSGQITSQQEFSLCPNSLDPRSWVPISLECAKAISEVSQSIHISEITHNSEINKNKNSQNSELFQNQQISEMPKNSEMSENADLKPSACSRGTVRKASGGWLVGGTRLKCVDASGVYCTHSEDENDFYALLAETIVDPTTIKGGVTMETDPQPKISLLENGMPVGHVIHFSGGTITESDSVVKLPFEALGTVFEPVLSSESNAYENSERCGYTILPYAVVNEIVKKTGTETGQWSVYDVEVEWKKKSYQATKQGDYKYIKESTGTFPALKPKKDPFDFSVDL